MIAGIVLIGCVIYGLSSRIQNQMEKAATENVREIVQIIESGITEIRSNDVSLAVQLAGLFTPEGDTGALLSQMQRNSVFARLSYVPEGAASGISSNGNAFTPTGFPDQRDQVGEASVTNVYMSDMGAWTYTVECPVYAGDKRAGTFYADVLMERYDNILPDAVFQGEGLVYILDAKTLRFVYEPTSTRVIISGKYDLHGFLDDFGIMEEGLEENISGAIDDAQSTIVRMSVNGEASYVYFWPIDKGAWYLCGIIPERSIQGESKAVSQTIIATSVIIFLGAVMFFLMFHWYNRKNQKVREEQINLFNGIARSIDDVVLLYDCETGAQELAFDNVKRILGVDGSKLSERENGLRGDEESEGLAECLRVENFKTGKEFARKVIWMNPVTQSKQDLKVETTFIVLDGAKKCIVSIMDITKEVQMQESLQASVLAAQNASKTKSSFLSQMSHEIRTPMNAVVGMVQIAESKFDDRERVADCLRKIKSSSHHLLSLINEILDISKIESQKMSLSEAWFSLDALLSDIDNIISVQAGMRRQRFMICNPAGNMDLLADQVRLKQVLMNLLNNSVKYTPEGGSVTLTIERKAAKIKDYCVLCFRIEDDGIGMSPEFQKKLFTPFEREDRDEVSAQTGTGLGLAIVQSMVSLMGGVLRVESELGIGTTFYVDVNFKYKSGEKQESVEEETQEVCDLTGVVILLAEDNELNREIAAEFLKMANAQVECAVDGVDAFEKFRDSEAGRYDIILMDMQMPRWDGLEATRQIRKLDRPDAATVPIIAVTANAYFEDEQKCLDAGMNDHVAKPLEMQGFYQKVKKYLWHENEEEKK